MKQFISVLCPTTAQLQEVQEFMSLENISYEDAVNEINHATERSNKCHKNLDLGKKIIKEYQAEFKIEASASSEDVYFKCYIENEFDYFNIGFVVNEKCTIEDYCKNLDYATEDLTNKKYHKASQTEIMLKTLQMTFGTIFIDENNVWIEDEEFYLDDITNIKINTESKMMTFNYLDDDSETVNYTVDLNTGIIG